MLIFRLKPGVMCSSDAVLKLSDVAVSLCNAEYEAVMNIPIHSPSMESYLIDALDITKAVSDVYPKLRVETRGILSTRVNPLKNTTMFQIHPSQIPDFSGSADIFNSSAHDLCEEGIFLPFASSKAAYDTTQTTESLGNHAKMIHNKKSSYTALKNERFWAGVISKINGLFNRKGGISSMSKHDSYQKIPSYSLDYQARPGDREERLKNQSAAWETRNAREADDNVTKEP